MAEEARPLEGCLVLNILLFSLENLLQEHTAQRAFRASLKCIHHNQNIGVNIYLCGKKFRM